MTQKTTAIFRSRKFIGINTQLSEYSDFACDIMLSREENPSPPVLSAAVNSYDTIRVAWTAPTTCADGTLLKEGAIVGYNVYFSTTNPPTTSSSSERVNSLFYIYPSPDNDTHYLGVTCVDNTGNESAMSNIVSGKATGYITGGDDPPSPVDGLYISQEYIGYYNVTAGTWVAYIRNNGDFFLIGADDDFYLQWEHATSDLTIAGTYSSAKSGKRIEIDYTGIISAYDSTKKRTLLSSDGLEVYDDAVGVGSRILYLPNLIATNAVFKYTNTIFEDTVIIGQSTDPATTDKLHVTGDVNVTGVITIGDHGSATSPSAAAIVYGTGSPPTASTCPEGCLYVRYIP